MENINFIVTLGSDDHEVLDDAVKRILKLADEKTNLTVFPIQAIIDEGTGRRIQRRRVRIDSSNKNILALAERIDFQKNVIVTANNGR